MYYIQTGPDKGRVCKSILSKEGLLGHGYACFTQVRTKRKTGEYQNYTGEYKNYTAEYQNYTGEYQNYTVEYKKETGRWVRKMR